MMPATLGRAAGRPDPAGRSITIARRIATISAADRRDAAPRLRQNEPNPINPLTVIGFEPSRRASVMMQVFSARGRPVAAGVHLHRLRSGNHVQTRRMVLVR